MLCREVKASKLVLTTGAPVRVVHDFKVGELTKAELVSASDVCAV